MEELRSIPPLPRGHEMDMIAIPTPTRLRRRLYLKRAKPVRGYGPKTLEDMTPSHKELNRLLNYFQDKSPTDTMFADHALKVFENVDQRLYPIWATQIEVKMQEIFHILDDLRYGHDTILLLSVISPNSYRVLYKPVLKGTPLNIPTFTLEHGITGRPLDRTFNLELRKAIFYKDASNVMRTLKTTMFVSFLATQMQADFHGVHLTSAVKEIKRVFWELEPLDTPEKDNLDMAYAVLCMMRTSRSSKSKICTPTEQIEFCLVNKVWYTVPRQTQELQQPPEDLLPPQPTTKKPKVSSAKKREDTRKRVRNLRIRKAADKNSYRTVNGMNSSLEFQHELRSRGSSITNVKSQKQLTNHPHNPLHSCKATTSIKSQSPGKHCH